MYQVLLKIYRYMQEVDKMIVEPTGTDFPMG